MSEFERAEKLLSQSLDIRREVLPEDHPSLATNLNDLAVTVHKLGDLPRAEVLFREALGAMIRVRGPEHPYVAALRNNLARLLRQAGKLEAAEGELRAALEIRRPWARATCTWPSTSTIWAEPCRNEDASTRRSSSTAGPWLPTLRTTAGGRPAC